MDRESGSPPCRETCRFQSEDFISYWVATAIGVVRPLAGLGSMDKKNALSHYSGVFHRPRSLLLYMFRDGKAI